jgi:hypothetical protein
MELNWTQIIIAFITALISSTGIITLYLKSRLDKAEKRSAAVKQIDIEIGVQKAVKDRYRLIYDDLLVRKVNGEQMNGELKASFNDYHEQCELLQKLYDERAVILRQM